MRWVRENWQLAAVIALAAVARFWNFSTSPGFEWDEPVYAHIGAQVAQDGRVQGKIEYWASPEPYLYHPPFYFLLLGGWFRAFGVGIPSARVLAILGSLAMLLLLGLFLRQILGRWSMLAVGLIAIDAWTVFTNKVSWIENTMMPLGVLGLWLYLRAVRTAQEKRPRSTGWFALAGVVLAATACYKHVGVYFLGAAVIHWLIVRRDHRKHLVLFGSAFTTIVAYAVLMRAWFGHWFDEQVMIQFRRAFGARESRGALVSLNDILVPIVGQYVVFLCTIAFVGLSSLLIIGRTVVMIRRRKMMGDGGEMLIFAWAVSAMICFAMLPLKIPHYFVMVIVPVYSYLALEVTLLADKHGARLLFRRVLIGLLSVVFVVNSAAYWSRFVDRQDNALVAVAAWTAANLPPDARVVTEESVGTVIKQPYCKMGLADHCVKTAEYVITYTSSTQKVPNTQAVRGLLARGEQLATFEGFKEKITVYKIVG